jgi:hypothetical protein
MELSDHRSARPTRVWLAAAATWHVLGNRRKLRDLLTDSDDPADFTARTLLLAEVGRAARLLGIVGARS